MSQYTRSYYFCPWMQIHRCKDDKRYFYHHSWCQCIQAGTSTCRCWHRQCSRHARTGWGHTRRCSLWNVKQAIHRTLYHIWRICDINTWFIKMTSYTYPRSWHRCIPARMRTCRRWYRQCMSHRSDTERSRIHRCWLSTNITTASISLANVSHYKWRNCIPMTKRSCLPSQRSPS